MTSIQKQWALVLAMLGASLLVVYWGAKATPPGAGALSAVPSETFLVGSVHLPGFAGSPFVDLVSEERGIFGASGLRETCGFDPLTMVTDVAFAVPEAGEGGDFAVIITGPVQAMTLAKCADSVLQKSGEASATSRRGTFTLLQKKSEQRAGAKATIAFREGGPVIVGAGDWLDAVLDTVEGKRANVLVHPGHQKNIASIPEFGKKAVSASVVLPAPLRERIKKQMGLEVPGKGESAMAGVLAVDALAAAFTVRGASSDVLIRLSCQEERACEEVESLLREKIAGLSKEVFVKLLGLSDTLAHIRFLRGERELVLQGELPSEKLVDLVTRALLSRKGK